MAFNKQKVIDIALAEVGYLEKASNKNLDDKTANAGKANYTKYARDLDSMSYFNGRKNGFDWCAVFVCWCFVEAFGKAEAVKLLCQPTNRKENYSAGCGYARSYFKAKGQLHDTPQPGDQIFYYSSDKQKIAHTGIVYAVDNTYVYTVEGNTSGDSGIVANGGGVFKKKHKLTLGRIAGYGRPAWGDTVKQESEKVVESTDIPESTYTTYTVKKGDTLWKIAQKLLGNGNKYKVIKQLNNLQSDTIRTGQVLKISEKKAETTETGYITYKVKKGDSLWNISKKYLGNGNRYKEIMAASGKKTSGLNTGEVLKIPKA